jgi:hypothetical protein
MIKKKELSYNYEAVSTWLLRSNAKNEKNAAVLLNRLAKLQGVAPVNKNFIPNEGHGYTVTWEVMHRGSNWNDIIVQVIGRAQTVGHTWTLSGDINDSCSAWCNRARVAGVQIIEWKVSRAPALGLQSMNPA